MRRTSSAATLRAATPTTRLMSSAAIVVSKDCLHDVANVARAIHKRVWAIMFKRSVVAGRTVRLVQAAMSDGVAPVAARARDPRAGASVGLCGAALVAARVRIPLAVT
ncbi:hypothetical protein ON010_g15777 [Phytophthora cinnamomi]|nr:hypothetical protein ON010_g15777 [Phytophthora cinnamomi]